MADEVKMYDMANTIATCPLCGHTIQFKHMHDAAHGLEGTHMVGSERFECPQCGHNVFCDSKGAEKFTFIFDGKAQ
jgi:DNA-directed RNA polymerase subunit RPC12/RpoP